MRPVFHVNHQTIGTPIQKPVQHVLATLTTTQPWAAVNNAQ
jgi:hypothetical protein